MKNPTSAQARKFFKGKFTFSRGDIQVIPERGDSKETTMWIDNRTERTERTAPNRAVVYPFAVDTPKNKVFIICPFCGEIHAHGNSRGEYEGCRVPHCKTQHTGVYFIKALPGD